MASVTLVRGRARPAARLRTPSRSELAGYLLVLPAVLYVLGLVGVPLVLGVAYSLSSATRQPARPVRRAAQLRRRRAGPHLRPRRPQHAAHRRRRDGPQDHAQRRPRLPAAAPLPGPRTRARAPRLALDGPPRAERDGLEVDARLAVQRRQLAAPAGGGHRPADPVAGHAGAGAGGGDRRQHLAGGALRRGRRAGRTHRHPGRGDRGRAGRRRRLVAPLRPRHRPAPRAHPARRPALRPHLHPHRAADGRLPPDRRRAAGRDAGPGHLRPAGGRAGRAAGAGRTPWPSACCRRCWC